MATQADVIAAKLNSQQWMEPLESGLKKGLDTAFAPDIRAGKPIENALHGVWLGHPLHPLLTDIPIGAWTVALVLDMIEALRGDKQYRAGADAAIAIGIIGAGGAAITGLTDWKEIDQEARRTGLLHGLLNTIALSLYTASSVQRNRRNRSSARALAYAAFGTVMVSGWLGGHLSYSNRIGVKRVSDEEAPTDFTPVLKASELEDSVPRRVEANGYPIVLVKRNNSIYAIAQTCTHAGGPLAEGKVENDCIRCPWHGSLFSLQTGEVVEGPSTHPVACFETRVHDDQIEVRRYAGSGHEEMDLR
jgi:nitrite reductase/ring-hydroxylating ferredoxin subunit/uncharacterized membrane protein